jgi:hypothetical protein
MFIERHAEEKGIVLTIVNHKNLKFPFAGPMATSCISHQAFYFPIAALKTYRPTGREL